MLENSIKISCITSVYKGEKYLHGFLENVVQQTFRNQTEIILVHNDSSEKELSLIRQYQDKFPALIKHLTVSREPLAVSTNRAMKTASGEYLCIWNIDDLRTPNSLELMAKTLDENQPIGFTYGDYMIVHSWQETMGKPITAPEFSQKSFVENMHLGPFYMWRKSLCEKIGYWDEQFKSGADFDYAVRLALESVGGKTPGLLGYYLDEGIGLSTGKTPLQPIERTVIELRYSIYHKLDFWYYNRAKKYRLSQILLHDKWLDLVLLCPNWDKYAEKNWVLIYAVFRYPFWIIWKIIKKLMKLCKIYG